jgi:hypothetical protein
MKKLLICLFTVTIATTAFSQSDSLQKNQEGIYEMSEVVNVDSASADDLYSNAKKFVAVHFVSGKAVTQLNDDNSKTVVGKGVMQVSIKPGFGKAIPVNVKYTFTIQAKDGRYKYAIGNFLFHNTETTTVTLEDESYWNQKKLARKIWADVKMQIYAHSSELVSLLKKDMASSKTENW